MTTESQSGCQVAVVTCGEDIMPLWHRRGRQGFGVVGGRPFRDYLRPSGQFVLRALCRRAAAMLVAPTSRRGAESEGLRDVIDGGGGDDFERSVASIADQVMFAARLPPVDRRRNGVRPPSSRLWEPSTQAGTSRVRRPSSVQRAGRDAADRRLRPATSGPGDASRSTRSRTPAPGAVVARLCRCGARTGCPADTAGRPRVAAPAPSAAKAATAARLVPTIRRPRSTAEYSHTPEQPNHHIGRVRPGNFNKIALRALSRETTLLEFICDGAAILA